MTASKPTDPTSANSQPGPERLGLSATQLVASGLAAMSATVAASFFGVAGTVIGAALGSVVTVIGNAVYGYSLRRTQRRVRRTLDVAVAHRFSADPARVIAHTAEAAGDAEAAETSGPAASTRGPKRLALAAAGLFAAVLAVTTAFEFAAGQPLSSTVTGKHGSGVSIGGGTSKKASQPPSRSNTPSSPGSPTSDSPASPTATVTVTPSESASPSESSALPSSSASGTPSPSGTPSGSATPAG